ncbi:MAG: SMP-30/gluconolactonase/LRE family protein [Planctomycetota bacterium]|nr:SMP-30/gluconolactonase/LRE family protein [Planctomycetota bacterium]MEE3364359.1 SMP-30/gluconolactonase/LRE family protein [Planctomycetota bacterium]
MLQSPRQLTRRSFLAAAAVAGLPGTSTQAAGISKRYDKLSRRGLLGEVVIETKVKDKKIFTEGPAVDARGLVYFTNVPAEKILTWDPVRKKLSVFRTPSNKANGLLFDPAGRLLACEGGAGRVTRTDLGTGKITVLADRYENFPLAAPNDLALLKSGTLFFTSRPGTPDPTKGNPNAVYQLDLGTKQPGGRILHRVLEWKTIHMPNGIVSSPDDKVLYLIEAHPDAGHHRLIYAYQLDSDTCWTKPRTLINFSPGRSGDGMCIDAEGNLYIAAGLHKTRKTSETLDTRPGIHVVSPEGKLLDFVETPVDTITNCAFGGKDLRSLYVTCGPYLLSIRTRIPGKAAYRPGK